MKKKAIEENNLIQEMEDTVLPNIKTTIDFVDCFSSRRMEELYIKSWII